MRVPEGSEGEITTCCNLNQQCCNYASANLRDAAGDSCRPSSNQEIKFSSGYVPLELARHRLLLRHGVNLIYCSLDLALGLSSVMEHQTGNSWCEPVMLTVQRCLPRPRPPPLSLKGKVWPAPRGQNRQGPKTTLRLKGSYRSLKSLGLTPLSVYTGECTCDVQCVSSVY